VRFLLKGALSTVCEGRFRVLRLQAADRRAAPVQASSCLRCSRSSWATVWRSRTQRRCRPAARSRRPGLRAPVRRWTCGAPPTHPTTPRARPRPARSAARGAPGQPGGSCPPWASALGVVAAAGRHGMRRDRTRAARAPPVLAEGALACRRGRSAGLRHACAGSEARGRAAARYTTLKSGPRRLYVPNSAFVTREFMVVDGARTTLLLRRTTLLHPYLTLAQPAADVRAIEQPLCHARVHGRRQCARPRSLSAASGLMLCALHTMLPCLCRRVLP